MNFLHFQSFMTTADCKSITAAAKTLFISPTSLMQQLNLLEKELGFKVFNRSRKGVTLTVAGQKLYDGCRKLMSESESLFQECKALATQEKSIIHICVSRPYLLFDLGKSFTDENPTIHIEFDRVENLTQDNIESHLGQGGFDMIQVGFDVDTYTTLPYELIPYPADRFCCVCAPSHSFSKLKSIPIQMLDGLTLHSYSNFSIDLPRLERLAESLGVHFTLQRSLFSEGSVLNCCANGGIYILGEQASRSFSFLTAIPIEPSAGSYIGLAYMKNAKPAVQRFAQYVRDHMDIIAAQYE